MVPDDTIALTCGADVNLNGLHVVTIAWSDAAAGSIIDFSFVRFATEGRPAAACEMLVLDGLQTWWDGIRTHPWGQLDDREGTGWVPDLTLIDNGWKDKQWGTEPVYILAAQAAFRGIHVSGTALAAVIAAHPGGQEPVASAIPLTCPTPTASGWPTWTPTPGS